MMKVPNNVIINVDEVENFILHTKNADYTLDFKKLIDDYGIVRAVDSDGERVNIGDVVYGLSDGKAWNVTKVHFGDYPITATDKNGNVRDLKSSWLTHKKSIEAMQDEINEYINHNTIEELMSLGNGMYDNVKVVNLDVVENALNMQRDIYVKKYGKEK